MWTSNQCLAVSSLIFAFGSAFLFQAIYEVGKVSGPVVDEEFHLPLGLSYCKFHFSVWDSKVTTLPGLYIISTALVRLFGLFLGLEDPCDIYFLRSVSLIAGLHNLILLQMLFERYQKNVWYSVWAALTIVLLPPLYFFIHVYYTDVVSLLIILIMFLFNEKGYNYFASLFGMLSILCRQTNAVWVGFVLARYIIVEMYSKTLKKRQNPTIPKGIELKNIVKFGITLKRNPLKVVQNMPQVFWMDCLAYMGVLMTFLVFIYLNGSVVVGDQSAHEVTLHIPQLFYFSLFCLIFTWPLFVSEISNFLKFARKYKEVMLVSLVIGLFIVHYNTLVHPYMLADNRHYVFYVWNRFYGRYSWFRYAMVPVYIFAWFVIIKILYSKDDLSWLIVYVPCVVAYFIIQPLIEVRYYLVPYVLLRLRVRSSHITYVHLILEAITHIIINIITFYIFFNKTITWVDNNLPQRIIW